MSQNDDGDESAEDEVEEEETAGDGAIEEGDYVRLDYTAVTVPEDEDDEERLVDTTSEERAAEEGIDTEEQEFGPRTIAVGDGHLFEEVEDALVGKKVGDTGEVTIPAADAFGEHNPDDVRTVSANKIDEDDRYPGAQVNVDGEQGYVETIIGGRARIDFNHPLAGEVVHYEFEIVDLVEDEEERASAVLELYVGERLDISIETETEVEEVVVEDESEEDEDDEPDPEPVETEEQEVEKRVLYIEATPELSMNQQWLFSKRQVVDELMHDFDLDRVVIRETFDHDDMHGGMGMGGMMPGMGGDVDLDDLEDVEGVDAEDVEEIADEIEDAEDEE